MAVRRSAVENGPAADRAPADDGARALVAGAARRALPLADGLALMGYGAREGGASGILDPLFARALYLSGGGRALLIECDLCLMAVAQARAIRLRVASRTGLSPHEILVGCTHTHSGPDSGLAVSLTGGDPPAHVAGLLDAAVEAGVAAVSKALPARLGWGETRARIGRNRRREGAPIDERVPVLRVDRADGSPLAVAFFHGCHPTVLGHDNLAYSADWPGAAIRRVERELAGAIPIFVPSGHADVDPRTRGLLDLAVEGQSLGASYREMEQLGEEVGEAVAACAERIETRGRERVRTAVEMVRVPVHGGDGTEEERLLALERRRAAALAAVELPPAARPRTAELFAMESSIIRSRPAGEARERLARLRLYVRDRTAPRIVGGRVPAIELQLMELGPRWVLGLPLECCADVAVEWARRLGDDSAVLVSIANGWLRYLPHERHFAEPGAEQRYEILQSTLVPAASRLLLDVAEGLARRMQADRADGRHGGRAADPGAPPMGGGSTAPPRGRA
ncbi:MAG: neutral/alkaline non-lysosomal ceramidase N-terminal domain-containing protein [Myxococcota bacterium]